MSKLISLSILCVLAQSIVTPCHAAVGHRYAVVVGVNDYSEDIAGLRFAVSDAKSVASVLTDPAVGGFEPSNVSILTSDSDDPELLPTRANIIRALHAVAKCTHDGDQLWFYFSGHGFDADGHSYLCPADTRVSALSSMLSVQDLRDILVQDCAPNCDRIVVLDACHSGSAKDLVRVDAREQTLLAPHVLTIASSGLNECSYEFDNAGDGQGYGVFTYFMVRGLRGWAHSESSFITASDLARYLVPEVSTEVAQHFLGARETPQTIPTDLGESWAKDLPLAHASTAGLDAAVPTHIVTNVPLGPPVAVVLNETRASQGQVLTSDIAETSLKKALVDKGFPVIDKQAAAALHKLSDPERAAVEARNRNARYIVMGTASTSATVLVPPFTTVTATITVRLVDDEGRVVDSLTVQSDPAAGGTELEASTQALQQAAEDAADKLIPELAGITTGTPQ